MASEPKSTAKARATRTAKTRLSGLVVVCAKCAKRQGLTKPELGRRVKRALRRVQPERKVKVVSSGCLGPCPKRLVAVATPASLNARRLLLIDSTCPASIAASLAADEYGV